jgi:putative serine protease PepD
MSDHTHRYPSSDDTRPLPPYSGGGSGTSTATSERTETRPPYSGSTPTRGTDGRGRARTAGLLVGALLVGGVGGVLGAAGYDAAVDDTAGTTEPATATSARDPLSPSTSDDGDAQGAADTPGSTIEAVAQEVLPSVVKLNVTGPGGSGSGSGVIISEEGEILTNDHVVSVAEGGGEIAVSFNDGSRASATIVGTDPVTDLAVVQAEDVSGLTAARIGDSDAVGVGEEVVAIGSPFGLEATVTSGIVSSLNRPVTVSGDGGGPGAAQQSTIYPAIQTDAAINPGNSGGPLVNLEGEVVGINSSIRSSSSPLGGGAGSIGLGFAIPISKVLPIVEQLRNGETATHAQLGVTVANQAGETGLVDGAAIEDITSGSAADAAGLEPGDVVTRVDDEQITNVDALVATIRGYRPGDDVTLTVLRGDEEITLDATLDSDAGSVAP